jgi:two-component system sensor histidine kinase BaeS
MESQDPAVAGESRRIAAQSLRHEIGNMVTIAQANVEGMIDGVVEPTLERLESVRDALASASRLLKELAVSQKEGPWRG